MVGKFVNARVLFATFIIFLVLAMSGSAHAGARSVEPSPSDLAVANSLEEAIRDSGELSVFTKLSIKDRYKQVSNAANRFKRGQLPEYDLKVIFESAIRWVERVVAKDDPDLHIQLVQARPVLWMLALKSQ